MHDWITLAIISYVNILEGDGYISRYMFCAISSFETGVKIKDKG